MNTPIVILGSVKWFRADGSGYIVPDVPIAGDQNILFNDTPGTVYARGERVRAMVSVVCGRLVALEVVRETEN